jgi:hypothetical protein
VKGGLVPEDLDTDLTPEVGNEEARVKVRRGGKELEDL